MERLLVTDQTSRLSKTKNYKKFTEKVSVYEYFLMLLRAKDTGCVPRAAKIRITQKLAQLGMQKEEVMIRTELTYIFGGTGGVANLVGILF